MNIPVVRRARGKNAVILSGASQHDAKSKDPCISAGPTSTVILSEASQREAKSKDPDAAGLASYVRTFLPAILLLFALLVATAPAHAQGCTQCLDSTRATPPAVQAAYRHAIELLVGVASTIFLIGLYLLRREP